MNIERAVRAIIDAQARVARERDPALLAARIEMSLGVWGRLRELASTQSRPAWGDWPMDRLYGTPVILSEELGPRGWRVLAANGDVLAGGGCNALGDELCKLLGHVKPEDCVEPPPRPEAGLVLD